MLTPHIWWEDDGFTLELDLLAIEEGKSRWHYVFRDTTAAIEFQGSEYRSSPLAKTTDEVVAILLSFLSQKPGDTDAEYFANYTPEQLTWAKGDRTILLGDIAYFLEFPEGRE